MDNPASCSSQRRRRLLIACAATIGASAGPVTSVQAAVGSTTSIADGEALVLSLGRLGPQLIAAGVIAPARFLRANERAGESLGGVQRQVLFAGTDREVAFDASNAIFLLNFFWAVGLANSNRILTRGPMMRSGMSRITAYASTGGWTLATRPVAQIYASLPLIGLTDAQQRRLEQVAAQVYRPCCDNPTIFPDCNHGMAMLGLLTRRAAAGDGVDALFAAAKTANRFWYPDATARLAAYVKATRGIEYAALDGREATGRELFSATSQRKVSGWATPRGIAVPSGGSSC